MALGHKCKKSYRDLVLKRGSVKMQVYGKWYSQKGPTWTFFTDGQFLSIPHVSLMLDLQWQRQREIEWEKERERERRQITSFRKIRREKVSRVFFFRFCHFFPMKSFPDQSYITSTKKSPGRKVCPLKTFSEGTLIYVRNL